MLVWEKFEVVFYVGIDKLALLPIFTLAVDFLDQLSIALLSLLCVFYMKDVLYISQDIIPKFLLHILLPFSAH